MARSSQRALRGGPHERTPFRYLIDNLVRDWPPPTNAFLATELPVPGQYVLEPGTSGNYVSSPHRAELNPAGDFTFIVYAAADDWTPAAQFSLGSKYVSAANGAWRFYVTASGPAGILGLGHSVGGVANDVLTTSTVQAVTGIADGDGVWLKFERTASTGSVDFFYSLDASTVDPEAVTWATSPTHRDQHS
jgi:hypothetical protein